MARHQIDEDALAAAFVELSESDPPKQRKSVKGRGSGRPNFIIATFLLALLVAPLAVASGEGDALRGGVRNPGADQRKELNRETQIIANSRSYGTRQSNKNGGGGGAIYGCRSRAGGTQRGNEPCIRANNLSAGRAFEFQATSGNIGGIIQFGTNINTLYPERTPFLTNGGGTVKNLSADRLDGTDSTGFISSGNGNSRGGGVIKFARVAADGTLKFASNSRIRVLPKENPGQYFIGFDESIKKCAFQVTLEDRRGTAHVNFKPEIDPLIEVQTWNEGLDLTQLTGPPGQSDPSELLDLLSALGAPTTQTDRAFSISALCLP